MLKKFQDMGKLLKQAQEMKSVMGKVQQELKETTIPISEAGGKIKVTLNGELDVVSVMIDPEFLDPSKKSSLESGIKSAFDKAIKAAKDLATKKLAAVSGGLIPGQ